MEPAVQVHLECFSDLMLNAGAKLCADIQVRVWFEGGLITRKSNPMGTTQGRTLLSS